MDKSPCNAVLQMYSLIPHGHALIWYYTIDYDDMYAKIAEIMKSET